MNTLTKTFSLLHYGDSNYSKAVNYTQSLYNFPITLNYGEKHNRSKYILTAGTSDNITVLQDGIFIYVVSENNGLGYVSLQIINTEAKQVESEVYLDGEAAEEIMDMTVPEQLNILFQY